MLRLFIPENENRESRKTHQQKTDCTLLLPGTFFNDTFEITMEMAAITAAFYVALYHEEKSARFQNFKDLNSFIEFNSSAAAVYLLHLARELFHGISNSQNIHLLVDYLAEKSVVLETKKKVSCECQVTIFSFETGHILERYPRQYDETCRQLWLLGATQNSDIVLSKIITDITTYFLKKKIGSFCFYCEKFFSGKGSKHKCRLRRSCFACHRPLLKPTTYTNRSNISTFCASEIEPKIKKLCKKCNVTTYNDSCDKIHGKKICRWGWFCLKCNQYTFRSKYLKTLDIIKKTHVCFTFFCSFCGERVEKSNKKSHLCPLFKLKPPQIFTKLGFVQLSFQGSNSAWCTDCSLEELCSFCIDNISHEKPNIGVFVIEREIGHFDSYTFGDLDLLDFVAFEKDCLIQHYIPDFARNQCRKTQKGFFNMKNVKVDKNIFAEEETVMGQILNFILERDMTNTTILINCSESNDIIFFVAELVKKGFVPKVLKQNGRFLLVECLEIGLRVLDSQNYMCPSISELSQKSDKEFTYFPRKWNKKSLYSYIGTIPPIKDFFLF